MGHIDKNVTVEQIIYKARELNPDFPGLIDFSSWSIGREFCKPENPTCPNYKIKTECKKLI